MVSFLAFLNNVKIVGMSSLEHWNCTEDQTLRYFKKYEHGVNWNKFLRKEWEKLKKTSDEWCKEIAKPASSIKYTSYDLQIFLF